MSDSSSSANLPRVLGASQATAVVVGVIIGSGIFLVPQEMMLAAGRSSLVYLAWIVGGLLSLFGAMIYAELGAMRPYAGGEYIYLRDAYGDLTAFFYMWTLFCIAKPASIATGTIGLTRILGTYSSFHWLNTTAIQWPWTIEWSQLFAIVVAWLVTGLNYLGVRRAGEFQLIFTWLKVLLIVAIVVFCFASPVGHRLNYSTFFPVAHSALTGFMIALVAALWAYDGWNNLNMVAGEIHQPERNVPIALTFGVGLVALLYIATNAAIQYVLPAAAIAGTGRPATAAMRLVAGGWGADLVSAGMAISIVAALNGTILSGARVPFAAAKDKLFFRSLARIHPRFQSPSTSLIVQAWMSTLLLLFIGKFQQLFELALFAEWLFYMLTATTLFVFRRREPDARRPYRTPGYPVLPAFFVLAAAVVLVYTFGNNLRNSLVGACVILAGFPLYLWLRRRNSDTTGPAEPL
ncbi:MAG TPA: amino acid permease [Acidobacteriaceae bacterium]|nr:amino acid permease [Acidobacteriaceae bacterium]